MTVDPLGAPEFRALKGFFVMSQGLLGNEQAPRLDELTIEKGGEHHGNHSFSNSDR